MNPIKDFKERYPNKEIKITFVGGSTYYEIEGELYHPMENAEALSFFLDLQVENFTIPSELVKIFGRIHLKEEFQLALMSKTVNNYAFIQSVACAIKYGELKPDFFWKAITQFPELYNTAFMIAFTIAKEEYREFDFLDRISEFLTNDKYFRLPNYYLYHIES